MLGVVFLTVFLDLIGFGILIPIQPFYAELLGARPSTVTLLSAAFSLVQFLCAPLLGRWSDRVGRRPVMLLTIAVNAAGYCLFGLAGSLGALFLARMTCGFGSANLGTAQAIVADITTPETRAKGMGLIGAAFGLGFIFGPAIGGFFSRFGYAVPAFVAAGLSLVNLVSATLLLPETRPRTDESSERPEAGMNSVPRRSFAVFSWTTLVNAAQRLNVTQLLLVYFVGSFAFSLMEQTLGLFIERTWVSSPSGHTDHDQFRRAATLTMYFLLLVGATLAVVQGLLIGRLARVFGERRLVQIGTSATASGLLLLPVVARLKDFALFMGVGPLIAFGSGITQPSMSSLLSQSVGPDQFGGTLGLGQSLSALGRVVGQLVAGFLFEVAYSAPFLIGAVFMVTCVAVAMTLRPPSES